MEKERRHNIELRAIEESDERILEGYAASYEKKSKDLGGFVEIIKEGAFSNAVNAIKARAADPCFALFNHDSNRILGTTANDSLDLMENKTGLKFRVKLPNTSTADEVWELVRGGYVDKCSFAFTVKEDNWKDWKGAKDGLMREIKEVDGLYDISIVANPAYDATSVSARALETAKELSEKQSEDRGHAETGDGSPTAYHELENLKELLEIESLIHITNKKQGV